MKKVNSHGLSRKQFKKPLQKLRNNYFYIVFLHCGILYNKK